MTEFKVGLLALATLASIVVMSLKITSNQTGFGDYAPYQTIVQDASGIFPKTPIKVAGINAGRIKAIELSGNQALIRFEILRKVFVPEGSRLRIRSVGFLGDKYLEIVLNTKSNAPLPEGSMVQSFESGSMDQLTRDASDVLQDIKVMVSSLKESLVPKEGEAPLTTIIHDVKDITASLKKLINGNEDRLNAIVENIDGLTEKLNHQMDKNSSGSLMADMKSITSDLKSLSSDLAIMAANIKAGKGSVGQLIADDKIADDVKETIAGVKKLVTKMDSIRTELYVHSGVSTEYGGETTMGLKVFPSPERFYLLGVATSKLGVSKEKETTTTVNGGSPTTTNETVVNKDTFRFNLQLGRKWGNWAFRGGVVESTGGVGVDYNLTPLRTTFTTEVFDYRKDLGINLRLASETQLWNVFYSRLAAEDITNKNRNYSAAVGLRFLDEDLKTFFGLFL